MRWTCDLGGCDEQGRSDEVNPVEKPCTGTRTVLPDIVVETRRVKLRPFIAEDLDRFRAIASEEEVLRYLPESDRMTPDQMKAVFHWLIECYASNTRDRIRKLTLPIVVKSSGEIVGWCGLGPLDFDPSEIELYIVISHDHWGQGYATEAGRAMLGYGFRELGLPRTVAVVAPANHASRRVIEKLEMKYERTVAGLAPEHRDYEGHLLFSMERSGHAA